MKREDKELVLKDLCARLPYKLQVEIIKDDTSITDKLTTATINYLEGGYWNVKPYLFPLSNMTEEQYLKWGDLEHDPLDEILFRDPNIKPSLTTLEHHLLIAKSLYDPINYCYENHFDIYGLIEKGLAIDATGLNIY